MINHIKKYMRIITQKIIKIPFFYKCVERLYFLSFPGSQLYWKHRYKSGGTSGAGSYNRLAIFNLAGNPHL